MSARDIIAMFLYREEWGGPIVDARMDRYKGIAGALIDELEEHGWLIEHEQDEDNESYVPAIKQGVRG